MTNDTELANVESLPGLIAKAAAALARMTTVAEVLDVIDLATVAYDAAKLTARLLKMRNAHADIIAACHRAQADALEIEAQAQCRLANEYDAAQQRGELATHSFGNPQIVPQQNDLPRTAAEVGLSRKLVHAARLVRDAERNNPGIFRRTLDQLLHDDKEPTRAAVKRVITPPPPAPASIPTPIRPAPRPAPAPPPTDNDVRVDEVDAPEREPYYCAVCCKEEDAVVSLIHFVEIDRFPEVVEDDPNDVWPGDCICDECANKVMRIIARKRGDSLIAALIARGGAMSTWQLPKDTVEAVIADGLAYINPEDDCVVYYKAIKNPAGGYTVPRDT